MNVNKIKCPNCGREYLPAEIFYPKSFFGQPLDIIKDEEGKVLTHFGTDMDLKEVYTCDKCGTTFTTEASINFKTYIGNNRGDNN